MMLLKASYEIPDSAFLTPSRIFFQTFRLLVDATFEGSAFFISLSLLGVAGGCIQVDAIINKRANEHAKLVTFRSHSEEI